VKSLQHQLSVMLGLSVVAVFFLFWWLSITTIHKVADDYVLTRLSHDSDSVVKNLHLINGQWRLAVEYMEPIYSQMNSGHYYVVKVANQTFRSPSLNQFPLFQQAWTKNQTDEMVYETLGPMVAEGNAIKRSKLLVLATHRTKNSQAISIYIAEDHAPIQESLNHFDWLFGLFALGTLILLYLLQKWILRRTFTQLAPLEKQLKELEITHQLNIDDSMYPKEVASLIDALRFAITQAGKQLKSSRQSNANLSHALKTPLNLAFQFLEQIKMDASAENLQRVEQQMQQQLDKIHQLIERELKKARIASDAPMSNRFDFNINLDELITTLKQLHQNKEITVNVNLLENHDLVIEKEDGFELFGNLLDNAFKWSQSEIRVSFNETAHLCTVLIEDDGKGVTEEQIKAIQTRGFRADEATPGHGIGLSIVKDLVEAYSGEITFAQSDLGGLQVQLVFKIN